MRLKLTCEYEEFLKRRHWWLWEWLGDTTLKHEVDDDLLEHPGYECMNRASMVDNDFPSAWVELQKVLQC